MGFKVWGSGFRFRVQSVGFRAFRLSGPGRVEGLCRNPKKVDTYVTTPLNEIPRVKNSFPSKNGNSAGACGSSWGFRAAHGEVYSLWIRVCVCSTVQTLGLPERSGGLIRRGLPTQKQS